MRWRLWDSSNPSVRTKGRSEEKAKGKTKRGQGRQGNEHTVTNTRELQLCFSVVPSLSSPGTLINQEESIWPPPFISAVSPPMNLSVGVQCSSVPYQSLLWSLEGAAYPHHGGTGNAAASVSHSGTWTRGRCWFWVCGMPFLFPFLHRQAQSSYQAGYGDPNI